MYSKSQIIELSKNQYVDKCSAKYISFSKECKYKVLELDKKRYFYKDIFAQLGFPEYVVNSQVPRNALKRWKKIVKEKGYIQIEESKKGRKKKEKIDVSKMSLEEQNEYLKAEVAYLKELHKAIHGKYP